MIVHAPVQPALCRAADLAGSFAVVPHSAGAGNTVYRLRLRRRTTGTCVVTGIPRLRLLGKHGVPLPTRVAAARPGRLTAVRVAVTRRRPATLTARFSPDVPGRGEPVVHGGCERPAYRVRVYPGGGGSLDVPVDPPTPVCEHGYLSLTAFSAG
jgi:hypothetical protein